MKALLVVLALTVTAAAQNFAGPSSSFSQLPDAPSQHHFWTLETKVNTGILAGLVAADAITTQRGLSQGYREPIRSCVPLSLAAPPDRPPVRP